jgi:ADP-heptose:LPS heptosyltransferase
MTQIVASISERGLGLSRQAVGPIAIHPGSGSREKCWPVDSFLELIERLHGAGHRCRILLGEVELERWPADQIHRLEGAVEEAVHPVTYLDLLRELSSCAAFVGNDSGPGHLAGIIGLPSVILFGPTDPNVWKPLGPRVRALRAEPISTLDADIVFQELSGLMPQTLSTTRAD